ncbi:MAG: flagellar export protein FliJ [Pseudomonadota bacterium]
MFNFRMQTVLDVRKTLEDKIISEFSGHQKELQHETESLRIIQQQKAALIDSLRNIKDKKVPVSEIVMKSAHINTCQEEETIQTDTVRTLKKKLDKKRDELLEATKKKKAMEICKTQHFEKYQAEERILERMAIDELVIAEYNRRKQE